MKRWHAMIVLAFAVAFSACSGQGDFAGLDVTAYGNLKEMMIYYLNRREELGLTPEQVEKIKSIRENYRKEVALQEADLKVALNDLSDLLQEDRVNVPESDEQVREVARKGEEIGMKYVRAVAEVKKLLTPAQLQKARKLMEK